MSKLVEHEEIKFFSVSDYKPLLTYSGDRELFKSIEGLLCHALPQDPIDWRRIYGRGSKSVKLSAIFVPFSSDVLKLDYKYRLLKRPILHTFWTQCSDLETYRNSLQEEIRDWLYLLNQHNIVDWVIILVETYDFRKHNKLLPRTTVLDKIKSDFCTKHADRCLSVLNPLKLDSGSSSSWRGLLVNIKLLMLSAYDDAICKLEEYVRSQRERRNDSDWSFCKYFLLQEELAFVLEMLGVYESALVQYDELDALFTQFLRNSSLTDTPQWLSAFQAPITKWYGLYLTTKVNQTLRDAIQEHNITLLDFRCYLYSRQAAMLMLSFKPWEVSQRMLPFIHSTLNELKILELNCPEGSIPCWIFLCCLEVVQMCQKYAETVHVDACSYYTASLLEECSDKLHYLGELCGLMPGYEQTSEQLHMVVGLSAGIGDSPRLSVNNYSTPTDKLKEALSCKDIFEKYYLELLEQAMVIYKHRSRIRSARLIGKKIADFYIRLGEFSKATGFLTSALTSYEEDGWPLLIAETRLQLLHCYKQLNEIEKFLRLCIPIASSRETDPSLRVSYFHEMMKIVQETEKEWIIPLEESFDVSNVDVQVQQVGLRVIASLDIYSKFPLDILCSNISLTVLNKKNTTKDDKIKKSKSKSESFTGHSGYFSGCVKHSSLALTRLPIIEYFEHREDKSLAYASITAPHSERILRRQDSHKNQKNVLPTRTVSDKTLTSGSVILKSGKNNIILTSRKEEESGGLYSLGQLVISIYNRLIFISAGKQYSKLTYEVKYEQPSFEIDSNLNGVLLAGIRQTFIISVNMGTYALTKGAIIKLRSSIGLKLCGENDDSCCDDELKMPIETDADTNNSSIVLKAYAHLTPQNDNSVVEHKVTLQCPWSQSELCLTVPFHSPFTLVHRVHTCYLRKFLLIIITGLTSTSVELVSPDLKTDDDSTNSSFTLRALNPVHSQPFVVMSEQKVKFSWELISNGVENAVENSLPEICNLHFSCRYIINEQNEQYNCDFLITDYKTLFTVESRVDPVKGYEFCRCNTTCHLIANVKKVAPVNVASLMYEVITDQTVWAVCGTSTGVIALDTDIFCITLDIMPLVNGFLPVPTVKLSKYFPTEGKSSNKGTPPKRESFNSGQVYNVSKSSQVHVLPSGGSDI